MSLMPAIRSLDYSGRVHAPIEIFRDSATTVCSPDNRLPMRAFEVLYPLGEPGHDFERVRGGKCTGCFGG